MLTWTTHSLLYSSQCSTSPCLSVWFPFHVLQFTVDEECHYIECAPWRFKSLQTRQLVQQPILASKKETSNIRITGICEWDPSIIGDSRRTNNAESIFMLWRHHGICRSYGGHIHILSDDILICWKSMFLSNIIAVVTLGCDQQWEV